MNIASRQILENSDYETIKVRFDDDIVFIQIYRPEAQNAINAVLVNEFHQVLQMCDSLAKIVVVEGLEDVFCFGADFNDIKQQQEQGGSDHQEVDQEPDRLYEVWLKLATGPFVSVAHVRGKANAGGIGFVAACDIVLAEEQALFSLSELLFGIIPACVMPFILRRMGHAKSQYMTIMTQPVIAQQAQEWGLVDAYHTNSSQLLRKHLLRLRRLNKVGIARLKQYLNTLDAAGLMSSKPEAVRANREVFSDEENIRKITRFVSTGKFPWES